MLLLRLLLLLLRLVKLDLCYTLQTCYTPWGGPYKHFWPDKNLVWLELVPVLNLLMIWLEIGYLHLTATTCARDLKLGTHLWRVNWSIFVGKFLFDLNTKLTTENHCKKIQWNWKKTPKLLYENSLKLKKTTNLNTKVIQKHRMTLLKITGKLCACGSPMCVTCRGVQIIILSFK